MSTSLTILSNIFKSCLNTLRDNEHLTGDKALRNLSYLLILKLLEPRFDHQINIDTFDYPFHLHFEGDQIIEKYKTKLLSIVRFSVLCQEKEEDIPSLIKLLWDVILSEHPATKHIFLKHKGFDIVNKSTFKTLLNHLSSIDLSNTEYDVLGEAYEDVIKDEMMGKVLGQYFTPPMVKNIMMELIQPKLKPNGTIEKIFDPAMGTGGDLAKKSVTKIKENNEYILMEFDNLEFESNVNNWNYKLGKCRLKFKKNNSGSSIYSYDVIFKNIGIMPYVRIQKPQSVSWSYASIILNGLSTEINSDLKPNPYEDPTHFKENEQWFEMSTWVDCDVKNIQALGWSYSSSKPLSESFQLAILPDGNPEYRSKSSESDDIKILNVQPKDMSKTIQDLLFKEAFDLKYRFGNIDTLDIFSGFRSTTYRFKEMEVENAIDQTSECVEKEEKELGVKMMLIQYMRWYNKNRKRNPIDRANNFLRFISLSKTFRKSVRNCTSEDNDELSMLPVIDMVGNCIMAHGSKFFNISYPENITGDDGKEYLHIIINKKPTDFSNISQNWEKHLHLLYAGINLVIIVNKEKKHINFVVNLNNANPIVLCKFMNQFGPRQISLFSVVNCIMSFFTMIGQDLFGDTVTATSDRLDKDSANFLSPDLQKLIQGGCFYIPADISINGQSLAEIDRRCDYLFSSYIPILSLDDILKNDLTLYLKLACLYHFIKDDVDLTTFDISNPLKLGDDFLRSVFKTSLSVARLPRLLLKLKETLSFYVFHKIYGCKSDLNTCFSRQPPSGTESFNTNSGSAEEVVLEGNANFWHKVLCHVKMSIPCEMRLRDKNFVTWDFNWNLLNMEWGPRDIDPSFWNENNMNTFINVMKSITIASPSFPTPPTPNWPEALPDYYMEINYDLNHAYKQVSHIDALAEFMLTLTRQQAWWKITNKLDCWDDERRLQSYHGKLSGQASEYIPNDVDVCKSKILYKILEDNFNGISNQLIAIRSTLDIPDWANYNWPSFSTRPWFELDYNGFKMKFMDVEVTRMLQSIEDSGIGFRHGVLMVCVFRIKELSFCGFNIITTNDKPLEIQPNSLPMPDEFLMLKRFSNTQKDPFGIWKIMAYTNLEFRFKIGFNWDSIFKPKSQIALDSPITTHFSITQENVSINFINVYFYMRNLHIF